MNSYQEGNVPDYPPARLSELIGTDSNLDDPQLYINRELSLLEFNQRVLDLARDTSFPLLERLRFLTICTSNLDEFFEIRVSGVKEHLAYNVDLKSPDGIQASTLHSLLSEKAKALIEAQYQELNRNLLPALEQKGVFLLRRQSWSATQKDWVRKYFIEQVLPVLTPIGLDPAHPFPNIPNKSLNFIINLKGKDAFLRSSRVAIVQAPRVLPRIIALPSPDKDVQEFVLLSSIIHANLDIVFPGMEIKSCFQFRVTRNSDLWVEEEEVVDLMKALQGKLDQRRFGETVRLEVADNCSDENIDFLLNQFGMEPQDLYRCDGPVNLHRLAMLYDLVDRPDLKFRKFTPSSPAALLSAKSAFDIIRKKDILLHHPFQSFDPVINLVKEASTDPDVLAIKLALYRTSKDSKLVNALMEAAKSGKEVTVVVELRARFDEVANIDLATRLQEVGVTVVYGIFGYKAHAKTMLIVRREHGQIKRYCHLGTGNYHEGTVKAYTDMGLLTCDDTIGEDVHQVFQQITGLGKVTKLNSLIQAPFHLHEKILALINEEADHARAGGEAWIKARMNSLIEPEVIKALYRASQAGVQIDLVVRGACALKPGIPGISENIRIKSVMGRFLEHPRIFAFFAQGQEKVYLASADWMPRNFFKRLELVLPIRSKKLKAKVMEEGIETYLADNQGSWELLPNTQYSKIIVNETPHSAQQWLLEKYGYSAGP